LTLLIEGGRRLSAKKILQLVGDYVEDCKAMAWMAQFLKALGTHIDS
jgi:hypothetical protein